MKRLKKTMTFYRCKLATQAWIYWYCKYTALIYIRHSTSLLTTDSTLREIAKLTEKAF